ncbi:tRNA pseudouridine(38-40) synthase TruA [Propionicicella superfundia]|uniref:tRNA pseudouridine(38-40) synthase TruA n=1 Tax=Propionicicella superfundia TaxID=348582 RepID=UPI00040154EE|nr:tRNA pseudouridine(38-40) synthase TruA [Propionicicella superfundia]
MTTDDTLHATTTVRLRLDISYDGTAFHGWAAQPGLRTVQGDLEDWTQRILRLPDPVELTCAGRTDAGVHARGQVAHVDLPGTPDDAGALAGELAQRYRRALPEDLAVRAVAPAPPGFDARFSAIWRRYVYRLLDADGAVDPLRRGFVARYPQPLDVAAMRDAVPHLVGLRDFASLCKAREGATTIRDLQRLTLTQDADGLIEIEVVADAFCHSMVRSLVGALVAVGEGRRDGAWLDRTLAARTRSSQIRVMAANGLVLEEVGYPSPAELAARAREARAVRTLGEP